MAEQAAPAAQPAPPPKPPKPDKAAVKAAKAAAKAEKAAAKAAAKVDKNKKPEPRTADPEQEKMMQVTSPQGWIALIAIGVTLVGVIIWSLVGSIPERIEGLGLVVRGGGIREIRASGGGTLTKLTLKI